MKDFDFKTDACEASAPPAFESKLSEKVREEALRAMDELAESAVTWEGHLPFDAALTYFDDAAVWQEYSSHVDECAYCQGLLEAIHPSDADVAEFEYAAFAARSRLIEAQEAQVGNQDSVVSRVVGAIYGVLPKPA